MLFWWPKFWAWQVFGTKPWQLTIGQDWTRTPPPFPWGSYKKRWDGGQGRLTTKRQLATDSACCCCQKDKNRHGSRFSQIMFLTIWFMVLFWHLLFLSCFYTYLPLRKSRKRRSRRCPEIPQTFYFWAQRIVWQMSQWSKRPPFAANEIDYWMVQKVHSQI